MEIVVLIKQTIDMDQLKLNENSEPITENLPLKVDVLSKNAIEAAIQLKEKYSAHVTGIIFGTDKSTSAMKEAYAMGVDDGIIVTGYKRTEPSITASVLHDKIKNIEFDLIILGNQSSDSYSGLLGGMLATKLGIPIMSNAIGIEIKNENVEVTIEGDKYDFIEEAKKPCVISVAQEINTPRLPNVMQIMSAGKKKINIEESGAVYIDNINTLSNKAPKNDRKKIIYEEEDEGIDNVAKILKGVTR